MPIAHHTDLPKHEHPYEHAPKGVVIFMEHRNTIDARECPRFKDKT